MVDFNLGQHILFKSLTYTVTSHVAQGFYTVPPRNKAPSLFWKRSRCNGLWSDLYSIERLCFCFCL